MPSWYCTLPTATQSYVYNVEIGKKNLRNCAKYILFTIYSYFSKLLISYFKPDFSMLNLSCMHSMQTPTMQYTMAIWCMKIIFFQVIWKLFQQQSSTESPFKSYSTSYPLKLEVQRRVAYMLNG
jgi:hypothetical protein